MSLKCYLIFNNKKLYNNNIPNEVNIVPIYIYKCKKKLKYSVLVKYGFD